MTQRACAVCASVFGAVAVERFDVMTVVVRRPLPGRDA
jgi:hypothetical protein